MGFRVRAPPWVKEDFSRHELKQEAGHRPGKGVLRVQGSGFKFEARVRGGGGVFKFGFGGLGLGLQFGLRFEFGFRVRVSGFGG